MKIDLSGAIESVRLAETMVPRGKVLQVVGMVVEASGPTVPLGDICLVYPEREHDRTRFSVPCEVVGFRAGRILLMPYGDIRGVHPGSSVVATRSQSVCTVGDGLLGRVVDGAGHIIDDGPPIENLVKYPLYGRELNPIKRGRINKPIATGIKAIDGLLTLGKGQRMGIFAGSGVGKSVLLGMIARNTSADINVIGLIGERGREVLEFIERDLGEEGLKRSVVVVSTSEKSPLVKARGALVATAIAEYFRDQGNDVLLLMDSVTRFAMALREVGLAVGEPPTTKGYTPSVFSAMPKLLERAGMGENGVGSITGLYTVLVEGDDMNEPVSDTVRSILDGHIVLSRDLAARNHYPAIDVMSSTSRLMTEVADKAHKRVAAHFRRYMAAYREAEDLINIGAYQNGSNSEIDRAIALRKEMLLFLRQGLEETWPFARMVEKMESIFGAEAGEE